MTTLLKYLPLQITSEKCKGNNCIISPFLDQMLELNVSELKSPYITGHLNFPANQKPISFFSGKSHIERGKLLPYYNPGFF